MGDTLHSTRAYPEFRCPPLLVSLPALALFASSRLLNHDGKQHLDEREEGQVPYEYFLGTVREPLSQTRLALAHEVFNRIGEREYLGLALERQQSREA